MLLLLGEPWLDHLFVYGVGGAAALPNGGHEHGQECNGKEKYSKELRVSSILHHIVGGVGGVLVQGWVGSVVQCGFVVGNLMMGICTVLLLQQQQLCVFVCCLYQAAFRIGCGRHQGGEHNIHAAVLTRLVFAHTT